jgi:predicted transcriptional regulator
VPSAPLNSPERTNQLRARFTEYSRELAEIREQKERLKRREKELIARCNEVQKEIDAQANRSK